MNEKLMKKLGLTEEDTYKPDVSEEIQNKQEELAAALEFILTEVIPSIIS